MNLGLLREHVDNALSRIVLPELKKDGSNAKDFFGVDTRQRQWQLNHGGYSRSELAVINEQENLAAKANLLEQMVDYTPFSNPTAGLTDVEISLMHRSKYQQTPNEMQTWLEGQAQIRDAKRQAAYDEYLKTQQKVNEPTGKEPTGKQVVVNPE